MTWPEVFELVASSYGWAPEITGNLTMEQAILLTRALVKRLCPIQDKTDDDRIISNDLTGFGIEVK